MSGREAFEHWPAIAGAQICELVGLTENGSVALLMDSRRPGTPALSARSVVDLQAHDIGKEVVVLFEAGDPGRPIVMGVMRGSSGQAQLLEMEADGQRLIVCANKQLVLRCGRASITLTSAGKVLIEGSYILTRSSGVNRIKGGSVQLN
jgi:hypothetical protein